MKKAVPILFVLAQLCAIHSNAQCTIGCGQSTTSNAMPGTNNFSNTFCITTASTLTYNQNFDMNGGTTCIGPNVTFSSGGGNYNGNWTINNYGTTSRSISLNSGQTFNNYGTFTGSLTLNGGTVVNYNGATMTPSSFTFNSGSLTNNSGAAFTSTASVTLNSGSTFTNNGTLSLNGLTLNSSANATLGGTTTINGSITNNGNITVAGAITVTSNFNQNSSGTTTSASGGQCNSLNITGIIQGQGTYDGLNGLVLNKTLSPSCGSCMVNGATVVGAPANQITGAALTASANSISGTIANPGGSPAATHYIVLRRVGSTVTDQPTDYRTYTVGNTIGSSTVVAVNAISTLSFTDANVIASNGCGTYHYAVFPLNSNGTCGTYNRTVNATNRSSVTIASVGGAVGSSTSICPGNTSGTLTLTGYTGSIVRWEYAVSPFSTWTTIANTTNSYTSGALSQTTQFRAVVNAGTGCSNANSTAATITVTDNTAPVISNCPGNQTINLDASCTTTMPNYTPSVTVSDNCTATGSIVVTQSPAAGSSLSGAGVQIVTITASDASGNSSNCTFNLTKQDITAPVISCPSNISTNAATGTCGATVTYSVTATDNCSGCAPATISGFTLIGTYNGHTYFRSNTSALWPTAKTNATALGAHLVTISSAGENTFLAGLGQHWGGFTDETTEGTWVWVTGEPVVYTSWNAGEPNNSGGNQDYLVLNYSGTNWDDQGTTTTGSLPYIIEFDCTATTMNLISGYASGSTFPVGTTTVTYNATDGAGNTSSNCSFTVTVNDVTAPMITCPANITVNAAAGACDAAVTYSTPVATDNCGTCSSAPAITGYTSLGIYNGNAYYISNTNATAAQGMVNASALGANMAAISSAGENTFIRNAATAAGFTGNYLIGLNDVATEGTFVWSSGEVVTYTNWNGGEPNNSGNEDYVQVYPAGTWNDIGAASSSPYVIEISCITPVMTSGLASGSNFPVGTSTINYSATDPSGNIATCSFTVTVNISPASSGRAVTAAAPSVCYGNSTNIQIALSDNGISYQLRNNATNANVGSPVIGTGGTINLPTGSLTVATTFNVYATGSGCSYQLNNTATVNVNALPVDIVPTAAASTVCAGSGTTIQIASSQSGVNYQLRNSTTGFAVGTAVAGTGGTINLPTGNLNAAYTYNVLATVVATNCSVQMSSTVSVTLFPLPNDRAVSAVSATICTGTGTNIQVASSQTGVNYQLRNNTGNVNIGSAVAGTGGIIYLPTGTLTAATTFNVLATNATTGCNGQLSATPTVTVSGYPTDKTISAATANVCPGSSTYIQVAASQSGVNYQLRNNADNSSVGSAVAGTGGTIILSTGALSSAITFNVFATNAANCSLQLTGTVTVTATDATPPTIICPANITVNAGAGTCDAAVTYSTPTVMDNCGNCYSSPAISGFTSLGIYNGNNYYISNTTATPVTAFTTAAAVGGQMASVLSSAENTFIRTAANTAGFTGNYFIGLTDAATEGTFVWSTGETVAYTNWNSGEPNNSGNEDYVHVYNSGLWNDIGTGTSNNYVIKIACITPTRTAGLASGSTFPLGTSTVTYSATDASGNTATCSFTVTVNTNPASLTKTLGATTNPVCINNSSNVTVALSDNGTSYQLRDASNTNIGSPVTGTGGTINLPTGNLATATTFNVLATPSGCGGFQLTNTITITVNPEATVTPGSTLTACQSASPSAITLSGASVGGSATTGAWSITSGGGTLSSTAQTATPATVTYTPAANFSGTVTLTLTTNDPTGPCGAASNTRTIIVNPAPANKTLTAAASNVCPGSGTNIQVAASTSGVNYQLRNNTGNTLVGTAVAGNGGIINLPTGTLSAATTFNVLATDATTMCSVQMSGPVTVSMENTPPVITCPATQTITLNGSCTATLPSYTSLATVSDNCTATGSIVVTQSPVAGTSITGSGTQIITLTATDASGNFSTCTFNLTKQDFTAPVVSCPSNITATAAAGTCGAAVSYYVSATDACPSCSQAPIAGYTLIGTYGGHVYYRSTTNSTWATAKTNAEALGAHLVTISSAGENAFVGGIGNHWGGMTDETVEGTWVWVTGEPVVYTSWASGEPNNSGNQDYLVLNWSGANWDDQGAAVSLPSVIEFECVTKNMVSGIASGGTFPVGTTTVTYNATDGAGNTGANCSFTVTVSLNPSSTGKTVSATTNPVCINNGTNVTVALSDIGTSYQLRDDSNTNIGSPVAGTGGTINLPTGNLAATTTFNVLATPSGCTAFQLTNTITITVNPAATVTPGNTLTTCQSASPSSISLSGASVGGSAATGAWSITAGGGTLSSTAQTATPATVTYTPAANYSGTVTLTLTSNDPAGPCGALSATRTITVNALPVNKTITATASTVCPGTSTNIQVAASASGVNYQLRNNTGNVNIGSTVAGNGGTINLPTGNLSAATTFNVLATDATTSCSVQMTGTVAVSLNALPADKTPTAASPSICSGSSTNIQIALSQTGVNYQLRNNYDNSPIGSAVAGNNGTINLPTGTLTSITAFNVLATTAATSCSVQMVNTVTVNINSNGQWVGGTTGDWNTASNWCGGTPGSSSSVNIPTGVTVNIQSANANAANITIASGASVVMTGAYNLTIAANGTFNNSGTFTATASTGTVSFAGNGTISGTTTFRNIDANGALDFGTASTVAGTFSIQPGGSVTGHSPTYTCPSSALLYRPGSNFTRGLEWASGSTGAGYPANVIVQNNTTINFPANGDGYVCYDVQIDAGSSLNQNYGGGSAKLSVGRNVTINGTLQLGGASGGDINVGGNWARNTGGVFTHNDRRVTFDGPSNFSGNGTSMSTITAPASSAKNNEGGFGGENFAHLWINKTNATDSVVLLSNVTVNRELGLTRGTFSLRNADVTMVSNSSRTAGIAPVTTPANVNVRYAGTGRFVVQRFIQNPTAVRSWRLLTAPLEAATAPTINNAWQEGVVNPDRANPNGSGGIYNPWPGYGIHITGPGGTYSAVNGFDHGTNSASILYANAGITSWVNPTNTTSTKITDQQGWMVFVRGDRGFAIGNQYVPSQNGTLEPKGKINVGDVSIPVTANKHIIGNPYASAISLLDVDIAGTAGKNSTYYMWDPKMFTSYTQPGKWVTFTGVGNSFVQTSSASGYATDGTIESGQAFALDVASAGNIVFHESDKKALSSSLVGIANRPASPASANFAMLRSDVYAGNGNGAYNLTDGVLTIFNETYNNAADNDDGKKMITFNTKESLSILRDSVTMAIEKRHNIEATDTIFFAMSKFNELPYQFKFTASNFAPRHEAFLEDKFAGINTPVNTDGETLIDFNITADPLSKASDRFRVVFRNRFIVLPVTFTDVFAKQQDKNIAVQWNVANEINVKQYEVEKSLDGRHFEKANTTISTQSSVYNWLDENAVAGDNYYRIRSLETNGRSQFSKMVKVNIGKVKGAVSVYPNPVTGGTIKLKFANMKQGSYTARLFSSNGQLVLEKEIEHSGSNTMHQLQANNIKGACNLELTNSEGKIVVKVIME